VFSFEHTRINNARHIPRPNRIIGKQDMPTVPKNGSYKDYVRYAEHCLNMTAATSDQGSRCIQREMAAEWLRLADAIRPSLKSWKIHPLKSR
jgi:hypothetical protein